MIPKLPSDPIKNYFRSSPVLSFLTQDSRFNTSPFPVTTSIPIMYPLRAPYLTKYLPPAAVATFPPKKHEPCINNFYILKLNNLINNIRKVLFYIK